MKGSEENLVAIGKVLKEWGIRGEMMILPLTFDPKQFLKLREIRIQRRSDIELRKIRSLRFHKGFILMGIEGCDSPENARTYRGSLIKIMTSESPDLPEGVYYHYQIIGLKVYTTDGCYLGQIMSIIETGGNDVYVVKGDNGKEYMLPAIKDVVRGIDIKSQTMTVKLMEVVEE
ncbi:MAG: ribosome maturation factor RimM [Thermodesulfovibrionales bacterium]|nr:ribosome maturation factor RimM [Thermodesulfovibrionales bacterium]